MNKFFKHICAVFTLFTSLQAQAADFSEHPGFLNLDELSFINGREPNVEVTLNGPILNMLLQLPIQYAEDDQLKELLKVVDQILVRVYNLDQDQADSMLASIGETSDSLEKQNWVRIVRVRDEDDSNVDIHVKLSEDGKNLNGLVIMSVEHQRGDEAEVAIVNISGNFDPAYLSNIGSQFNIDHLEGVQVP